MASELMKVKLHATLSNVEADLLTVTAAHTFTILNISLCETGGNAETFDLYVRNDAGADDFYIYKTQALAANATFEHTTRLTLEATDVLSGILGSTGDVDVVITYLDQTL